MKIEDIINNIIYLPTKFHNRGNVSIYSLLNESGYFELHEQITEENIIDGLIEHPESINQWLSWSENKRSESGWYFKQNIDGKYVLGYFSNRGKPESIEYSDIKKACAAFIKREIEDIRTS